jgi:tetratricopeptide (TPR) repeat protein
MDRSPCRTGLIGAWATLGLLCLPGCSRTAPSPSAPHRRTPVVAETPTDDRPGTAPERVSRIDRREVVPASHLFAPPPLPSADQTPFPAEPIPSSPIGRTPVVRLAPVPGNRVDHSPRPDMPRRLPEANPSEPEPGEPHLLQPLSDIVSAFGDGADEPVPWRLPPVPEFAAPQDARDVPEEEKPEEERETASAAEGADDRQVQLFPPPAWDPVTVPVPTREDSAAATARDREAALAVLARQVDAMSRRAEDLAMRGAYFAARAEMIKALRLITQVLDAQSGEGTHSRALGDAMRAFREAADFLPRGSQLEAELNVSQVVSGHRTPILKQEHLEHLAPVTAQQRYFDYAQRQLVVAGGGLPAASRGLHALAKICTVLDQAKLETQTLFLPQAVALHQAALLVDPGNYHAANELSVLLARFGQWEDARRVLLHGLAVHGAPEMWCNLSVVHEQLGEPDLARRARHEADLAAVAREHRTDQDWAETVRWVDASTFSAAGAAVGH